MEMYRCPKCKNLTLDFNERTRVLSCSHYNPATGEVCGFQISLPEQSTPLNVSQVTVILAEYENNK